MSWQPSFNQSLVFVFFVLHEEHLDSFDLLLFLFFFQRFGAKILTRQTIFLFLPYPFIFLSDSSCYTTRRWGWTDLFAFSWFFLFSLALGLRLKIKIVLEFFAVFLSFLSFNRSFVHKDLRTYLDIFLFYVSSFHLYLPYNYVHRHDFKLSSFSLFMSIFYFCCMCKNNWYINVNSSPFSTLLIIVFISFKRCKSRYFQTLPPLTSTISEGR